MFKFLKTLFIKKKKNLEYLYFYVDRSDVFGDEEAKKKIFLTIKDNLRQHRKELQDRYVFTDEVNNESLHILGSRPLNFPWFQPLILEIYAFYKKGKDLSVLSYPFEEIIIKHKTKYNNQDIFLEHSNNEKTIYILKFRVQC